MSALRLKEEHPSLGRRFGSAAETTIFVGYVRVDLDLCRLGSDCDCSTSLNLIR
jgi:hypothetical protein